MSAMAARPRAAWPAPRTCRLAGRLPLPLDSQSCHSPSRPMHLIPDVECDQQCGHRLYDAGILQLAAIDGAHPGNLDREIRRDLPGAIVVAAYNDVAIDLAIAG